MSVEAIVAQRRAAAAGRLAAAAERRAASPATLPSLDVSPLATAANSGAAAGRQRPQTSALVSRSPDDAYRAATASPSVCGVRSGDEEVDTVFQAGAVLAIDSRWTTAQRALPPAVAAETRPSSLDLAHVPVDVSEWSEAGPDEDDVDEEERAAQLRLTYGTPFADVSFAAEQDARHRDVRQQAPPVYEQQQEQSRIQAMADEDELADAMQLPASHPWATPQPRATTSTPMQRAAWTASSRTAGRRGATAVPGSRARVARPRTVGGHGAQLGTPTRSSVLRAQATAERTRKHEVLPDSQFNALKREMQAMMTRMRSLERAAQLAQQGKGDDNGERVGLTEVLEAEKGFQHKFTDIESRLSKLSFEFMDHQDRTEYDAATRIAAVFRMWRQRTAYVAMRRVQARWRRRQLEPVRVQWRLWIGGREYILARMRTMERQRLLHTGALCFRAWRAAVVEGNERIRKIRERRQLAEDAVVVDLVRTLLVRWNEVAHGPHSRRLVTANYRARYSRARDRLEALATKSGWRGRLTEAMVRKEMHTDVIQYMNQQRYSRLLSKILYKWSKECKIRRAERKFDLQLLRRGMAAFKFSVRITHRKVQVAREHFHRHLLASSLRAWRVEVRRARNTGGVMFGRTENARAIAYRANLDTKRDVFDAWLIVTNKNSVIRRFRKSKERLFLRRFFNQLRATCRRQRQVRIGVLEQWILASRSTVQVPFRKWFLWTQDQKQKSAVVVAHFRTLMERKRRRRLHANFAAWRQFVHFQRPDYQLPAVELRKALHVQVDRNKELRRAIRELHAELDSADVALHEAQLQAVFGSRVRADGAVLVDVGRQLEDAQGHQAAADAADDAADAADAAPGSAMVACPSCQALVPVPAAPDARSSVDEPGEQPAPSSARRGPSYAQVRDLIWATAEYTPPETGGTEADAELRRVFALLSAAAASSQASETGDAANASPAAPRTVATTGTLSWGDVEVDDDDEMDGGASLRARNRTMASSGTIGIQNSTSISVHDLLVQSTVLTGSPGMRRNVLGARLTGMDAL